MNLPDFFGLDIGNHTIRVMQVDRSGKTQAKLVAFGSVSTPFGLVGSQDAAAKTKLAEKIKDVVKDSGVKTKLCIAALPEASIFTRLITRPKVDEAKLEESIYWEARQYIPLPAEEVQMDWIPIQEKQVGGNTMVQLLLVAAPKTLVNRYVSIVEEAGLELIALETETIATSRAVTFGSPQTGNLMILDLGSNGTDMSVLKDGKMIFSQSLSTGSDSLTKAIANDFNLELAQAEQYKVTYGLDGTQAEGKIYKSIEPLVQIIADEVNRTLAFFRTQLTDSIPAKIVIVGAGAQLKKLDSYLASKINVPVELVDPVKKIEIPKKLVKDVDANPTIGFTVALGLALKAK